MSEYEGDIRELAHKLGVTLDLMAEGGETWTAEEARAMAEAPYEGQVGFARLARMACAALIQAADPARVLEQPGIGDVLANVQEWSQEPVPAGLFATLTPQEEVYVSHLSPAGREVYSWPQEQVIDTLRFYLRGAG
jgi:hypothetical protein